MSIEQKVNEAREAVRPLLESLSDNEIIRRRQLLVVHEILTVHHVHEQGGRTCIEVSHPMREQPSVVTSEGRAMEPKRVAEIVNEYSSRITKNLLGMNSAALEALARL